MLAEAPADTDWIVGMCRTIRATWFTPDMGDRERRAWIETYLRALHDLPAPILREAWDAVVRKFTRRPSPAEVRLEATALRDRAREAVRLRKGAPRRVVSDNLAPQRVIGPEERERVAGMMRDLSRKLRVRRQQRAEEQRPPQPPPRRRTDEEIRRIIAANPARKGMTVERFREIEEGRDG